MFLLFLNILPIRLSDSSTLELFNPFSQKHHLKFLIQLSLIIKARQGVFFCVVVKCIGGSQISLVLLFREKYEGLKVEDRLQHNSFQ